MSKRKAEEVVAGPKPFIKAVKKALAACPDGSSTIKALRKQIGEGQSKEEFKAALKEAAAATTAFVLEGKVVTLRVAEEEEPAAAAPEKSESKKVKAAAEPKAAPKATAEKPAPAAAAAAAAKAAPKSAAAAKGPAADLDAIQAWREQKLVQVGLCARSSCMHLTDPPC